MTPTKDLTFSIVAYKNYAQIINAVNTINKFTNNFSKEIVVVDNTEKENRKNYFKDIQELTSLDNVNLMVNNGNLCF